MLPATAHLTGPDAIDVLAPAVEAAGGELVWCRANHVQYRPQSDLVVQYRCGVRTAHGTSVDTVLAATTVSGPPAGTVPIEATPPTGDPLTVGVWRWPFDPVLVDLSTAVTPTLVAELLDGLAGRRPELDVVAYRPTERAVVRVRSDGRELYLKVLPAGAGAAVADRQRRLRDAGLPVPEVLAWSDGWVAMEALHGTTLRERVKAAISPWPRPDRFRDLLAALADVDLPGAPPVRSRILDAPAHAAMLATVLPAAADRLESISARLTAAADLVAGCDDRPPSTVHGDLHEAQIVVDDDTIVGLLDIDDVGPGDPLADVATLLGHLEFRALVAGTGGATIAGFATALRDRLVAGHDPRALDLHEAAVLVGLATGPFRIQQEGWESTSLAVLDRADELLRSSLRR